MRFCLLSGIVFAVLAVLPFSPAHAKEEHKADEHKGEDHKGEAQKGEDHKDEGQTGAGHSEPDSPFKGWIDLTIWTVVVFLLLVGVLYTTAWKQIQEGLDKRESDLARDKEEAQSAREEAAKLREQLQAEMARAQEQVKLIFDKARREAETAAAEVRAKGNADVQVERERLTRDLDTARAQALQQIWNEAAQLATLISAKVIQRQLNGDDHRQLIDAALNELRQSAEERKRDHQSVHA